MIGCTLTMKKQAPPLIPKSDARHKELKNWCTQQRTMRTEGRMLKERIMKLDKIGFAWDFKDVCMG